MKKLVEQAVYEKLRALAGGQVYALRAPQNVSGDFIVFQRVNSARWRSINAPSGVAQATIQVDSYSNTYYGAKELGALVETELDGFRGIVAYGDGSPQETIDIGGISLQSDVDLIEQTDEPFLYRNLMTFLVTYDQ